MHHRGRLITVLTAVFSVIAAAPGRAAPTDLPEGLDPTGPAGFIVHVPATDGQAEIRLAASGRAAVQGLARTDEAVLKTRQAITAGNAYGPASVRKIEAYASLPYVSNLVTILIIDADALGADAPTQAECLRVLHPNGTLHLKKGGTWSITTKPMPKEYGEWSHAYGGADNNMHTPDTAVGAPTGLRWISGPPCDDEGAVSNGLRIGSGVAVHDLHFMPWRNGLKFVEGRNAFNGLPTFLTPLAARTYKTRPIVVANGKIFTYLTSGSVDAKGKIDGKPGPLVAFDAVSGKLVKTYDKAKPYVELEHGRDESPGNNLIFAVGMLYQTSAGTLEAIDPESGEVRWTFTAPEGQCFDLPSYSAATGRIHVALGKSTRYLGRNAKFSATHIMALDAKTGTEAWRTDFTKTGVVEWNDGGGKQISQIACVADGVYLYRSGGISALKINSADTQYLAALDAATGTILWHHEGFNAGKPDTPNLFDVGGQKLEMTVINGKIYLMSGGIAVFDAKTGQRTFEHEFGNSRCDASHSAGNTLLLGFGNLIDLTKADPLVYRQEIVRGHCATGLFPAYGMTFGTPSRCRCAVVLHAYMALSSDPNPVPVPDDQRLTQGPAFGTAITAVEAQAGDWPVYLGTPARSSYNPATPQAGLKLAWSVAPAAPLASKDSLLATEWRLSAAYPGPVSAPVIANGRLFAAIPFQHRLEARDLAAPDKPLWSFTADGRIDTPPTVHGGLVVFGDHAGYVYCLDTATGSLRWKFLAAPTTRQIVAYAQPESSWPVYGAVPVVNNTVVAIAGYHPEADGGLFAWGLDPATGAIKWKRTIARDRKWLPATDRADEPSYVGSRAAGSYNSNNIANSLMVCSDKLVSIQGYSFDAATGQPTADVRASAGSTRRGQPAPGPVEGAIEARMPFRLDFNETSPERSSLYLTFSGPGHHNGSWSFWVRPAGAPEAFNTDCVAAAFSPDFAKVLVIPNEGWKGVGDLEFYDAAKGSPNNRQSPNKPLMSVPRNNDWHRVAIVLAGDAAVVAERQTGNLLDDTTAKSHLELRSLADGKVLQSIDLPAPPIENGLAVASGKIYVTLTNGKIVCFGP